MEGDRLRLHPNPKPWNMEWPSLGVRRRRWEGTRWESLFQSRRTVVPSHRRSKYRHADKMSDTVSQRSLTYYHTTRFGNEQPTDEHFKKSVSFLCNRPTTDDYKNPSLICTRHSGLCAHRHAAVIIVHIANAVSVQTSLAA